MSDHIQTSAIPGWIISTVRTHPKAPGVYQGTEDCSSETEVSTMHIEKHFSSEVSLVLYFQRVEGILVGEHTSYKDKRTGEGALKKKVTTKNCVFPVN